MSEHENGGNGGGVPSDPPPGIDNPDAYSSVELAKIIHDLSAILAARLSDEDGDDEEEEDDD